MNSLSKKTFISDCLYYDKVNHTQSISKRRHTHSLRYVQTRVVLLLVSCLTISTFFYNCTWSVISRMSDQLLRGSSRWSLRIWSTLIVLNSCIDKSMPCLLRFAKRSDHIFGRKWCLTNLAILFTSLSRTFLF